MLVTMVQLELRRPLSHQNRTEELDQQNSRRGRTEVQPSNQPPSPTTYGVLRIDRRSSLEYPWPSAERRLHNRRTCTVSHSAVAESFSAKTAPKLAPTTGCVVPFG